MYCSATKTKGGEGGGNWVKRKEMRWWFESGNSTAVTSEAEEFLAKVKSRECPWKVSPEMKTKRGAYGEEPQRTGLTKFSHSCYKTIPSLVDSGQ